MGLEKGGFYHESARRASQKTQFLEVPCIQLWLLEASLHKIGQPKPSCSTASLQETVLQIKCIIYLVQMSKMRIPGSLIFPPLHHQGFLARD
jgi:hypothetical protein